MRSVGSSIVRGIPRRTVETEQRRVQLSVEVTLLHEIEIMKASGREPYAFHVHTSDVVTPETIGGLPVRRNALCPPGKVFLFDMADDAEACSASGGIDV
jgi:hypothetical protein